MPQEAAKGPADKGNLPAGQRGSRTGAARAEAPAAGCRPPRARGVSTHQLSRRRTLCSGGQRQAQAWAAGAARGPGAAPARGTAWWRRRKKRTQLPGDSSRAAAAPEQRGGAARRGHRGPAAAAAAPAGLRREPRRASSPSPPAARRSLRPRLPLPLLLPPPPSRRRARTGS